MSDETNACTVGDKVTIGPITVFTIHHPTLAPFFDGRIFLHYDGEEAEFPAEEVAKVLIEYFRKNF